METEHAGELEVLGEEECRALLAANRVGRIAIVVDDQPAIFPVNYVFDDNSIVFRTNWPVLAHASLALLAFQMDRLDIGLQSRWSVMVQGVGHDITEALDVASEHLQDVPVPPWVPGSSPRLLRLVPRTITGHRFR
jgi:uncharacterized protein